MQTTKTGRSGVARDAVAAVVRPEQPERWAILAHRVAEGSARAFADLYDALASHTLRVVLSRLRDPEQAESVLYATFVEVWWMARCHDAGRGTDVAAWITGIATRRACERQLAGRRHRGGEQAEERDTPLADWTVDLEVVHDRLTVLALAKLLGRRPADLRPYVIGRPTVRPSSTVNWGTIDRARIARAPRPSR